MIRPAGPADAPRLAELSGQLGYPTTPGVIADRLRDIMARPGDAAVFVAIDADRPVAGWVHVGILRLLESPTCGEILGLVVDEKARTGGIGRSLVAAAEQWVRGHGLATVVVRSNVVRTLSHPFYERIGYRRTKSQHYYVREL